MMGENPMNGNSFSSSLAQMGFANEGHRTLYIGNLDPSITEDFIQTLFSVYGRISGLKMISDNLNDPYCFVEFEESLSANNALTTMNKRNVLGREIKVNWATSPTCSGPKPDTSKHFHIFVGDLSTELESAQLRDAFAPFGEISDCRVVRDPHTMKSKGYGFVSFLKKADAENAIANMNSQWLGSRPIRTNWASRKPPGAQVKSETTQIGPNPTTTSNRQLNFEEVYSQSSLSNCTVYCGGITNGLGEDMISKAFIQFGQIQEIRVFKDKGYAFIKFMSHEAATNAIVMMHNQELQGQTIKCSWGKESTDGGVSGGAQLGQAIAPSMIYPYGQQMSYNPWYGSQQGYSAQPPYGVPPSGVQYSYNQYYGSQPNQANPGQYNLGMGQGSWQNSNNLMQGHSGAPPHLPASMHHNSAMGPYPMQGYQ